MTTIYELALDKIGAMTTVQGLAHARKLAAESAAKSKAMLEAFQNSPDYAEAKADATDAAALVERLENTLRAEALGKYEADQNKKGEGYEIKTETSVEIPDTQAAINWCKANFTPALKLNESILKTAAKNGTIPPEIVTVTNNPKVYIKSDLSEFLEE